MIGIKYMAVGNAVCTEVNITLLTLPSSMFLGVKTAMIIGFNVGQCFAPSQ